MSVAFGPGPVSLLLTLGRCLYVRLLYIMCMHETTQLYQGMGTDASTEPTFIISTNITKKICVGICTTKFCNKVCRGILLTRVPFHDRLQSDNKIYRRNVTRQSHSSDVCHFAAIPTLTAYLSEAYMMFAKYITLLY